MRFLGRFIFHIFSNAAAILVTNYFLPSFFSGNLVNLAEVAVILTLINTFIKPLLEFLSAPFIFLTFGLFTLVVNAISIYLLDILSQFITIQNIQELMIATIIISVINFILGTAAKKGFSKE
jgi:putative membrane protein